MGTDAETPAGAAGAFESAYDAYLDACLEGGAEAPEAYCAARGITDPALVARIASLHAAVGARASAAPRASAVGARATGATRRRALPYDTVGGFRLVRRLGAGGMGEVFLAEQRSLGRLVALKVIRPELQAQEQVRRRFEREARAVARLRHDGIVRVHELGQDGDLRYIAMELVAGRPLDQLLADGPLEVEDVLRWGAEVADALAYAHGAGVVHRDVKPGNVMITPEGHAVLLDFGMVHLADLDATRLTQTFAGSPAYAAPEQVQSGDVDPRTDVYALGVTLFESLTGGLPFPGTNLGEVFRAILSELPPPASRLREGLPPGLDAVLAKCLEKRPADRYPDAAALRDDLLALCRRETVAARRPPAWRRLLGWGRRRPVHAAALSTFLVAALGVGIWKWEDLRREQRLARDLVATARADVDAYDRLRPEVVDTERRLAGFLGFGRFEPPNPAHQREHEALLDHQRAYAGRLQALRDAAVSKLRQARRIDPAIEGADAVEVRLLAARLEDAVRLRRDDLAETLRSRLTLLDPDGPWRQERSGRGSLTLWSDPPDAEVFAWRYVSQRALYPGEGDRRLVPVSLGAAPPGVRYGAFALRVTAPAADFGREDLIVEVDGQPLGDTVFVAADAPPFRAGDRLLRVGDQVIVHPTEFGWLLAKQGREVTLLRGGHARRVEAGGELPPLETAWQRAARGGARVRVFRRGRLVEDVTPPGLRLRPTATPAYLREDVDRLGRTGEAVHRLEAGQYLLLVRKPGHEDAWAGVRVKAFAQRQYNVRLLPTGSTPPGFVWYPLRTKDLAPFWIQEREVTMVEYLAYLNSPVAQSYITLNRGQGRFVLFPRDMSNYATGGFLPRDPDGRFQLPETLRPDVPVGAISWEDARMYAGWRSVQDKRTYRLPTHAQWQAAAGIVTGRRFPCGETIRQTWVASNYARAYSGLKGVLQFPIDESPGRVYDLMGGAREMLDHPWGKGEYPTVIFVAGYDWADPVGDQNAISAGIGQAKGATNTVTGFRLAIPGEVSVR